MASIQIPVAVHESVVAVGTLRSPAPVIFSWAPSSRPLRVVNTNDNRLVAPFAYVPPPYQSGPYSAGNELTSYENIFMQIFFGLLSKLKHCIARLGRSNFTCCNCL